MSRGILIIEDEAVLAKKIAKYLRLDGFETRIATSGEQGLEVLTGFPAEAVILDFNLPGKLDGLDLLPRIRAFDPGVQVIMITGQGNERIAVDAMKAGAYDYLSKPLVLSELKGLLHQAIGAGNDTPAVLADEAGTPVASLDAIIGHSPAIRRLKARLARIIEATGRVRNGSPPVLVTGETGSGKELVARALHFGGQRSEGPFIEQNVATLPVHLVESELFGYERGAFTDARTRKIGLAEAANGGTLFLDEIGELDPAAQAKVLKLLEDRSVRRLGGIRDHQIDIQIVTATNRPLQQMVAAGTFRQDLYYRLNTLTIEVPTLRERPGDIGILANHFTALFAHKYDHPGLSLGGAAHDALGNHDWPGNIRELRNTIEQAVLHCDNRILTPEDLGLPAAGMAGGSPASPTGSVAGTSPATTPEPARAGEGRLDEVEKALIQRTLDELGGNVSATARRLGISRDRLRYRIDKYGLDR